MSETAMTGEIEAMPCLWGGGNDYMACRVCHLEYDYRVAPKPPCGAADALARLTAELARVKEERDGFAEQVADETRDYDGGYEAGAGDVADKLEAMEARALTAEAERDQLKIGNHVLDELVAEHCGKRLAAEAALAKAVEDEREACALVADKFKLGEFRNGQPVFADDVATAIRARANGESP